MKSLSLFFIASFLFLTTSAQASFLQIVSRLDGNQYYLKNNGNEAARDVHPFVRIGTWTQDFEGKDLEPGDEAGWEFALKDMRKNLVHGRHPMPIMIRYKDLNGYAFSVPEVRELSSTDLTVLDQKILALQMFKTTLTVEPIRNQEFRVRYELENITDNDYTVQPQLLIPEELKLKTAMAPIHLGPKAKVEGFFEVHNEKALVGSYYNLIAVFSYDYKGLWNFQSVYGGINITKDDVKQPFQLNLSINWWWLAGCLFVLGYLLLYRLVIRPLSK